MGLFQPIWMSKKYKDESKAIQAVRRISDSDKLLRIANSWVANLFFFELVVSLRGVRDFVFCALFFCFGYFFIGVESDFFCFLFGVFDFSF